MRLRACGRSWRAGVAAVLVAVSCTSGRPQAERGAGAPEQLASSLEVSVRADTVVLRLHVTNATAGPLTLEFPSTQRYDFAVSEPDGDSVWRWSAARSFAQVLTEETLPAGASVTYEARWTGADEGDDYVATGWLTARNYPVELRTTFRTTP